MAEGEGGGFSVLDGGESLTDFVNSIEHVVVGVNPSIVYQSEDEIKLEVKNEITSMEEVSDIFLCNVCSCNETFSDEIDFKIHKRLHRKIVCELCAQEVASKAQYTLHMQKYHNINTTFTRELIQDDNDESDIEEIDTEIENKNHQVPTTTPMETQDSRSEVSNSNIIRLSQSQSPISISKSSTSTAVQNLNETVFQSQSSLSTTTTTTTNDTLNIPGNENINTLTRELIQDDDGESDIEYIEEIDTEIENKNHQVPTTTPMETQDSEVSNSNIIRLSQSQSPISTSTAVQNLNETVLQSQSQSSSSTTTTTTINNSLIIPGNENINTTFRREVIQVDDDDDESDVEFIEEIDTEIENKNHKVSTTTGSNIIRLISQGPFLISTSPSTTTAAAQNLNETVVQSQRLSTSSTTTTICSSTNNDSLIIPGNENENFNTFRREVIQIQDDSDSDESDVFIEEIDTETEKEIEKNQLQQVPTSTTSTSVSNIIEPSPIFSTLTTTLPSTAVIQNLNETDLETVFQSQSQASTSTSTINTNTNFNGSLIVPGNENIIPRKIIGKTRITLVPERVFPSTSTSTSTSSSSTKPNRPFIEPLPKKQLKRLQAKKSKKAFLRALDLESRPQPVQSNVKDNHNNNQNQPIINQENNASPPHQDFEHLSIMDEVNILGNRNSKRKNTEDNEPPSTFDIVFGHAFFPPNIHVSSQFENIPKFVPGPAGLEMNCPVQLSPEEEALLLNEIGATDERDFNGICFQLFKVDPADMTLEEKALLAQDVGVKLPHLTEDKNYIEINNSSSIPNDINTTTTTTQMEIQDPDSEISHEKMPKISPSKIHQQNTLTTAATTQMETQAQDVGAYLTDDEFYIEIDNSSSPPKTWQNDIETTTTTATTIQMEIQAPDPKVSHKKKMSKISPSKIRQKDTTTASTTTQMETEAPEPELIHKKLSKILSKIHQDTIATTSQMETQCKKSTQTLKVGHKKKVSPPKIHPKDTTTTTQMETQIKCKKTQASTTEVSHKNISKILPSKTRQNDPDISTRKIETQCKTTPQAALVSHIMKRKLQILLPRIDQIYTSTTTNKMETQCKKTTRDPAQVSHKKASKIHQNDPETCTSKSKIKTQDQSKKRAQASAVICKKKKISQTRQDISQVGHKKVSKIHQNNPDTCTSESKIKTQNQSKKRAQASAEICKKKKISQIRQDISLSMSEMSLTSKAQQSRKNQKSKVNQAKTKNVSNNETDNNDIDYDTVSLSSSSSSSSSDSSISWVNSSSSTTSSVTFVKAKVTRSTPINNIRKSPRISSLPSSSRPETDQVLKPKKMPPSPEEIEQIIAEGGQIFPCDQEHCNLKFTTEKQLNTHYFAVHKRHYFPLLSSRRRRRRGSGKKSAQTRNNLTIEEIEEVILSSDSD